MAQKVAFSGHIVTLTFSAHIVTITTGLSHNNRIGLNKWHFPDLLCSVHRFSITTGSSFPNRICLIYHDFRDLNVFHPLFGFKSQIMTLSQKIQKSDFLGHCSFTQLFYNVEKLRRKPKIFVKVIQRFWYVQLMGLIFFKNHQKQSKLQLC